MKVVGTTGVHISCGMKRLKHKELYNFLLVYRSISTMWHSQNRSKCCVCSTMYEYIYICMYICDLLMFHMFRNNPMQSASTAGKKNIHHVFDQRVQSAFSWVDKLQQTRQEANIVH